MHRTWLFVRRFLMGLAMLAGSLLLPAAAEEATTPGGAAAVSAVTAIPPPPAIVTASGAAANPLKPRIIKGTADHSKFDILKKPFASGPEVTAACLTCHTEASKQVMGSIHYSWTFDNKATGQKLGKRYTLNSFCGNVGANEPRCTSCHAGYNFTDVRLGPPQNETAVDCLVCHDTSGQYAKLDNAAGNPALAPVPEKAKTITGALAKPSNLTAAALSVGGPRLENCGQCHFNGGGGDNVKHGDLSSALYAADTHVDVHMASKDNHGQGMMCSTCHKQEAHQWHGSRYAPTAAQAPDRHKPGAPRTASTCESCHGNTPHKGESVVGMKLNDHTDRVACQTCHIPTFAKGGVATKTLWDWSTAGKLKDGKPIQEDGYHQGNGKPRDTYLSTKGTFAWGEEVKPHYAWFNGTTHYVTDSDVIDPKQPLAMNWIDGAANDPASRIHPFKLMHGKQAYDTELNHLLYNQVYGPKTDTAFWTNFSYDKSLKAAMDYMGKPYSGKYGFVETTMLWPITHMVAKKDEALKCTACHAPQGVLASLGGFYMPGREPLSWVNLAGLFLIFATLAGVGIHALGRLISSRRRSKQ